MVVSSISGQGYTQQGASTQAAEDQEFLKALEELDAYLESQKKNPEQKRREEQAELERKAKTRRMADLQMQITALRSRINMGFENAEGELEMLKSQLFHLQLFG